MAGKARAKKAPPKKKSAPAGKRPGMVVGAAVLGGLLLVGGGWVGLGRLDAMAVRVATPAASRVVFAWPSIEGGAGGATWMPASEQARLEEMAGDACAGGSALDSAPLREVSRVLEGTGWFAQAPRSERLGDGSVRVSGRWRVPAAVVRVGDRERLVSWDGYALPLIYAAGRSGVRFLLQPTADGPSGPGKPWGGKDVGEGLALLGLLDASRKSFRSPEAFDAFMAQVHGIDLQRGRSLEIVTDRGTRVVWGAAPGAFQPGEQTAEVKLDRLRALFEKTGRIDGGMPRTEIHGTYVLHERPER